MPPVRIELTAFGLQDQRSATELRRRTLKSSSRCKHIPNYRISVLLQYLKILRLIT